MNLERSAKKHVFFSAFLVLSRNVPYLHTRGTKSPRVPLERKNNESTIKDIQTNWESREKGSHAISAQRVDSNLLSIQIERSVPMFWKSVKCAKNYTFFSTFN